MSTGSPILDVELPLKQLVPSISAKTKKTAYYTYKGSLTTPGCYESVRWVILKKPAQISGYMVSSKDGCFNLQGQNN